MEKFQAIKFMKMNIPMLFLDIAKDIEGHTLVIPKKTCFKCIRL